MLGWRMVLLAILTAASSGCTGWVIPAVFYAPNKGRAHESFKASGAAWLKSLGVERELRVTVGPPRADIRVWVLEPLTEDKRPQGTIVQLHGYRNRSIRMLGMARKMARRGFRVLLADMRGHGGSSGDYISYGVLESRDFVQVVDRLMELGEIKGPLGVWGISMGASTAIQWAAKDARVMAVVAVAPYTTMHEVVPHVLRTTVPPFGWMIGRPTLTRLVNEGAAKAGFDPDEADTYKAVQNVQAPVLILHGKHDWIVPVEHGRLLYRAAPHRLKLVELPWIGHVTAHYSEQVGGHSADWFAKHLGDVDHPDRDTP